MLSNLTLLELLMYSFSFICIDFLQVMKMCDPKVGSCEIAIITLRMLFGGMVVSSPEISFQGINLTL